MGRASPSSCAFRALLTAALVLPPSAWAASGPATMVEDLYPGVTAAQGQAGPIAVMNGSGYFFMNSSCGAPTEQRRARGS